MMIFILFLDFLNIEISNIDNLSEFTNNISIDELKIIKLMISYPYLLFQSVNFNEPHRLVNYLEDLCSNFHSIWNKGKDNESLRFINEKNLHHTKVKIFWIQSFRLILKDIFSIIGINTPERM